MNPEFRTLSPGAPGAIKRAYQLVQKEAAKNSSPLGDYYEFGLFRGGTFLATSQILKELKIDSVHQYGFDSFKGLPPASDIDADSTDFFEGQFACDREEVEENLAAHGMDMQGATLIEGYYEDSLTEALHAEHPFNHASVVLLDCDYYTSTKTALDWITRYLRFGTVLLFDDWFSYGGDPGRGQQKALSEWLAKHPEYTVEHLDDFEAHGRGFVLRQVNAQE